MVRKFYAIKVKNKYLRINYLSKDINNAEPFNSKASCKSRLKALENKYPLAKIVRITFIEIPEE